MTFLNYKKTNFDSMDQRKIDIAEKINAEDKAEISRLMERFIKHKDARGNWQIPRKEGLELLPFFQEYVDPNARSNIFGCGGCAKKMVDFMFQIYKLWQSPTT